MQSDCDLESYVNTLRRYAIAKRALENRFREFCEVVVKIGLLTNKEIQIEVSLVNRGTKHFAYVMDWVPEMTLYVWREGEAVNRLQYIEARKDDIIVDIQPGGSYDLTFTGGFEGGNLVFSNQGVFEGVGNDFEIAYTFLRKSSERIRVRIPG